MGERPLLMGVPLVRQVLAGVKTQTRRPMKQQPSWRLPSNHHRGAVLHVSERTNTWIATVGFGLSCEQWDFGPCPFGQAGDRLWVRETFYCDHYAFPNAPVEEMRPLLDYRATHDCRAWEAGCPCADEGRSSWRPSIHMPRWACRLVLEITDARPQRLRSMGQQQHQAEGITQEEAEAARAGSRIFTLEDGYRIAFGTLWDGIYGCGAYEADPWVWALTFKAVPS